MLLEQVRRSSAVGSLKSLYPSDKLVVVQEEPIAEQEPATQPCNSLSQKQGSPKNDHSWYDNIEDQYHVEVMLRHIYRRAQGNGWFLADTQENVIQVAVRAADALKTGNNTYLTAPHTSAGKVNSNAISILDLAGYLQCEAIIAINSKTTSMFLRTLSPVAKSVALDHLTNIQILDCFEDFVSMRRSQFAAFIREFNMLLIWSDDVNSILEAGRELEDKMVHRIWDEKYDTEVEKESKASASLLEAGQLQGPRSVSLVTPMITAISILAIAAFIGQDLQEIVLQIKADSNYMAICIILYFPLLGWLAAFFAQTFAVLVVQAMGPVSHLFVNTRFYSGQKPARRIDFELPHITVQCPVYKEDLRTVLTPAILSVREAVKTYEMQGGTANIFINDDGLQVIDDAEAAQRKAFYKQHNIGYIARPPHSETFQRAGKFKKASNMNYAMNLSYALEERLGEVERSEEWTDSLETFVTESTLDALLSEQSHSALGGGDIRMGDIILLIDADTRIPADCFLDAAIEMHNSPEVAILQHTSLAFQVVNNYWEDCMTYFAMFVSQAMQFMTAGGDVCPFIGHNAFLRWSAMQEIQQNTDGQLRWWSETHVSEDFELSMRLQNLGYVVRMAAYSNGEFKEGVSLTVYDEFNRWQKYAFGVSELCFNPVRYWFTKSPFTPLFRAFLSSRRISGMSKFTMIAYMGSYYAIASAWILALINYILSGWFSVTITKLYQSAFQILIATLMVYDVAVPIINGLHRYRIRQAPLFSAIFENFKWILILCIFFGGLSLHIAQSLMWHLLGIPLHWEATAKSLESSCFSNEVPMIWRKYKYLYALLGLLVTLQIVLASALVPDNWRIVPSVFATLPIAWVIACHALAPLILNPQSWLGELHL